MSGGKKGTIIKRKSERFIKTKKRCTWIDEETGEQCKDKAIGHYFCETHFKMAGRIEHNLPVYSFENTDVENLVKEGLELSEMPTMDFKIKAGR